MGYLTGCADTAGFARGSFFTYRLPLLYQILMREYRWNADVKRFVRRTFRLERGPNDGFPRALKKRLAAEYPAHLHVNLLPEARGGGIGSRLIDQFCADLKDGGARGVHLFCGDKPLEFYRRNGFERLESVEFKPGLSVHCLGRRLGV